jgi:transposase-like protein
MTGKSATEIRELIQGAALKGGRRNYSPELKQDIMDYAKKQTEEGVALKTVAEELGLNDCVVGRWYREKWKPSEGQPSRTGFIEVKADLGHEGFEVRCPNGFSVKVPLQFEVPVLRQLLSALGGW